MVSWGLTSAEASLRRRLLVPRTDTESWTLSCGHPRQRMDPIFRFRWWKDNHPEIVDESRDFNGWMDFLVKQMTGQGAIDRSSASLYMTYDLLKHDWDLERADAYGFPREMLPKVPNWGQVIGELTQKVAESWGAPPGIQIAQGCLDLNCAAYGAGVHEVGTACLVSGSYENVLVPTNQSPTFATLDRGLAFLVHPCETGKCVIAVHPTGNAVLNWARSLFGVEIDEAEKFLRGGHTMPSPVIAIPHLSGSMAYWEDGRRSRGGLIGLTLATTGPEIIQAIMEGIAYDTALSFSMMAIEGIEIDRIRITGGGARSAWWTQLKADLTGRPIEVVEQAEPGTFGAALLAGLAIGVYEDIGEASTTFAGTKTVYLPNPERAEMHQERFDKFKTAVGVLLEHVY